MWVARYVRTGLPWTPTYISPTELVTIVNIKIKLFWYELGLFGLYVLKDLWAGFLRAQKVFGALKRT